MGRKRSSSGDKPQKKKAVTVKILEREHAGKITTAYRLMDSLIEDHHDHLIDAKIAIAWRFGWKPDVDGRVKLSSVKKGSDLDREMHNYDFVICLNHEVWNEGRFNELQMRALIDHALCRCQVSKDSAGETRIDENNRIVYRLRSPDVQEFREIVARHGLWTADLEQFGAAIREAKSRPLFGDDLGDHKPTLPMGAPRSAVANRPIQRETAPPPAPAAEETKAAAPKRGRPSKAHKPPAAVRPPLQKAAGH